MATGRFCHLANAIRRNDEQAVAQLLAQSPHLACARGPTGRTALHFAAFCGCDKIVAQLLAVADPTILLAQVPCEHARTALHYAAKKGHDIVVAQLLAASPDLVHVVDEDNQTALHLAAAGTKESHEKVVACLLRASSRVVDAIDSHGRTVLHFACSAGNHSMAEMFLTIKPGLAASAATIVEGETILHVAARGIRSGDLFKRLLELNPDALRAVDKQGRTPFSSAVLAKNDFAIESLQWGLTFHEIASAFVEAQRSLERFKPVVAVQCECLGTILGQDVMGIVYEHLGFEKHQQKKAVRDCDLDDFLVQEIKIKSSLFDFETT